MQQLATIDQAITNALSYLAATQKPDGSFISFSSNSATAFKTSYRYTTTFTPALILAALSGFSDSQAKAIRSRLAQYLLYQKSEHWSFNYWARGGKETTLLPYPDDLDDTFCALGALALHDRSLIDEAALAHIVKLLVASESQVGGPYFTWLVASNADEKWRDIDIAVNANIAYFLELAVRPLPHLTNMLAGAIAHARFSSPYYVGELPVIYFIARSYRDAHRNQLEAYIVKKQKNGFWKTPLQTALALSSLIRLGNKDQKQAVDYLLKTQKKDGSWSAEAFCLDPKRNGEVFYSGSPALTTAFVLEALKLCEVGNIKPKPPREQRPALHKYQTRAITNITREIKGLDEDLHRLTLNVLHKTVKGRNGKEITLLPYLIHQSLKERAEIPEQTLLGLSAASTYGWMAYTIYDDFLDNEGDPRLLSVANVAMRSSLESFDKAVNDDVFRAFVRKTFDTIDAANTWETIHCRFYVKEDTLFVDTLPTFKTLNRLAERSLGHALVPLGVLSVAGISVASQPARVMLHVLRHYLIARQLNDDLHDWREDIGAGRITYVVKLILEEAGIKKGEQAITVLMPSLERCFWHKVLPYVCRRIISHVRAGQKALSKSELLQPDNVVEKLLNEMEISVDGTCKKLKQTERFLHVYRLKNDKY